MIGDWIYDDLLWVAAGLAGVLVGLIVVAGARGWFDNTECDTGVGTNISNGQPIVVTMCHEKPNATVPQ